MTAERNLQKTRNWPGSEQILAAVPTCNSGPFELYAFRIQYATTPKQVAAADQALAKELELDPSYSQYFS